ncbi:MAG: TetR/AcrR family transcriptional regulator [Deltaproteobacteria bacterium]|nr:TetR/AcrR family transcriptional regulator [Deltaproteobacteria bacterium]
MPNGPESRTAHHDEKLQGILKTAAAIFAEKGFDGTSIRDISRATGMSLAGLYYYFRTKEELLCLIQERCLVTLLETARKIETSEKAPREKVALFVHNHLGFFLHNMNEMKVMSREDTALTADYEKRILELKRRYVKALVDLVEELQRNEGAPKLNVRVAALALFGMMNWVYTWYNPSRDPSLEGLIEQVLRIFFFGVLHGEAEGEGAEDRLRRSFLPDDKSFVLWPGS